MERVETAESAAPFHHRDRFLYREKKYVIAAARRSGDQALLDVLLSRPRSKLCTRRSLFRRSTVLTVLSVAWSRR
jgi:hypothetical protein